jgi:hypothetical protein
MSISYQIIATVSQVCVGLPCCGEETWDVTHGDCNSQYAGPVSTEQRPTTFATNAVCQKVCHIASSLWTCYREGRVCHLMALVCSASSHPGHQRFIHHLSARVPRDGLVSDVTHEPPIYTAPFPVRNWQCRRQLRFDGYLKMRLPTHTSGEPSLLHTLKVHTEELLSRIICHSVTSSNRATLYGTGARASRGESVRIWIEYDSSFSLLWNISLLTCKLKRWVT